MYSFVALFFVYMYFMQTSLGNFIVSVHLWFARIADSIGFHSLAHTIDLMGYKLVSGTGMVVISFILSAMTIAMIGVRNVEQLERNA